MPWSRLPRGLVFEKLQPGIRNTPELSDLAQLGAQIARPRDGPDSVIRPPFPGNANPFDEPGCHEQPQIDAYRGFASADDLHQLGGGLVLRLADQ